MAERKRTTRTQSQRSQDSQSKIEQAQRKTEQLDAESKALSALDDPKDPEKGSPWRQTAYLGAVVFGGFILNLVVMVVIASGT